MQIFCQHKHDFQLQMQYYMPD